MGMYQVDILPQRSYLHTQTRGTIGGTVAPLRNRKNFKYPGIPQNGKTTA